MKAICFPCPNPGYPPAYTIVSPKDVKPIHAAAAFLVLNTLQLMANAWNDPTTTTHTPFAAKFFSFETPESLKRLPSRNKN